MKSSSSTPASTSPSATPSASDAQRATSLIAPTSPDPTAEPAPLAAPDHGQPPVTFGERHGLKVLGGIGLAMFTLVIVAQVGC